MGRVKKQDRTARKMNEFCTPMHGEVDAAADGSVDRKRRWAKAAVRIAISLALFALVIASVGDEALLASVGRASRRWFVLIPALLVMPAVGFGLGVLRLSVLLRAQQIRLPASDLLQALLIGTFFNQLLPTSVGGDAYSTWYISRRGGRLSSVLATIFLGRMMGVVAMCLLVFAGCALKREWFEQVPALRLGVAILAAGLLGVVGLLVWLRPPAVEPQRGRWGVYRKWFHLTTALHRFRAHRSVLVIAMTCSIALQVEIVAQYWLFGWSLGIDLPFIRFLVAVPLVTLAAMLPFSLNGVGIREWVMIGILTPIGIGEADAAVMAMLFVVAGLCYASIGAMVFARSPIRPRFA